MGGGTNGSNIPKKMLDDVKSVSMGVCHTMVIKNDGSLWAWGVNGSGQLGDGTIERKDQPVKIMNDVESISAGSYYTMAIKSDDSLWAWGENWDGQIGDGTAERRITPVKIMDSVKSVSAGDNHTIALKADGTLWAWGNNDFGKVNNELYGLNPYKASPLQIMDDVKLPTNTAAMPKEQIDIINSDGVKPTIDIVTPPKKRTDIINFDGVSYEVKLPMKNVNGHSFLPFRESSELFGASVSWNDSLKVATCELNGVKVEFIIGSAEYRINDVRKIMDAVPFIDNSRTYIPIRYLAEGLGFTVGFEQTDESNIYIISS